MHQRETYRNMIKAEFKTNSYTRRTDDVVWMWAANDLFTLHPELADYKDRHGVIMPNRDILGIAFAVILGVVDGDAAKAACAGYPESDLGVPLFHPFISGNKGPHNQAVWPFTVSFYFWGKSLAYGEDYSVNNAAILARSLGTAFEDIPKKRKTDGKGWGIALGSFHEKINLPSGKIDGSDHQLWSAAAFLNVCILAGLIQE